MTRSARLITYGVAGFFGMLGCVVLYASGNSGVSIQSAMLIGAPIGGIIGGALCEFIMPDSWK